MLDIESWQPFISQSAEHDLLVFCWLETFSWDVSEYELTICIIRKTCFKWLSITCSRTVVVILAAKLGQCVQVGLRMLVFGFDCPRMMADWEAGRLPDRQTGLPTSYRYRLKYNMYTHIYIYVHMYNIYVERETYVYISLYMYTYIYGGIHMNSLYINIYVYIYIYLHIDIHKFMVMPTYNSFVQLHVHMFVYISLRTYMCIYIYLYIYIYQYLCIIIRIIRRLYYN